MSLRMIGSKTISRAPWIWPWIRWRQTARALALATAVGLAVPSLAALPASQTAVAADVSREYLIKAAFLYNFAKFTRWPENSFVDSAAPVEVCVFGQDPFGTALDSITGKTIRGRPVAVRRIASVDDVTTCHLLFISESEATRLAPILQTLSGRPVLTVADMPNFARDGGIINLKTNNDDKGRFEINVATAKRAGLKFSSKLLSLAEITSN